MKTLFSLFAVLALTACATTTTNTADEAPAEAAPAEAAPAEAAPAEAAPAEAPEASVEIPVFNWDQVSAAMGNGAILVDSRGANSYAKGHIEGAISVPCKSGDEGYAALPEDKATQLIFYCGGPACSASNKGALAASERGYTKLAEYKGGYPEWKSQQPAAE